MKTLTLTLAALLGAAGLAHADDCPAAVKTAIDHGFPKATINSCKPEQEHGHAQFEVVIMRPGTGRAEIDVSPDGKILEVEEQIPLAQVPAVVMKAFSAKYPKAKVSGAEKETPTGGKPSYELAFDLDGKHKEVTFTEAGAFVEEE